MPRVRLHRVDSVWNYQFIADYFSSPPSQKTDKKPIVLLLQKMTLTNIHVKQLDEWRGQDQQIDFKKLSSGS